MEGPKSTKLTKPVATAKSENEPTDRDRPVLHPQGGERPRRAWRSLSRIDDDWTQSDRKRGRRNDTLWIPEAEERTQPKKPEAVAESKYEPTDYEQAVLAKQAERLKDQVRVPRIRFVEDEGGGRQLFDHPDQAIAFALIKEAFGRQTISLPRVCYTICARHCRPMSTRHLTILGRTI
jgi:hypothetical protein